MTAAGEQVLVVERERLFPGGTPQGAHPLPEGLLAGIARHGFFAPRAEVEEEPALKQIIPYALIVREKQVFLFRRSTGGAERRLHGLRSVGVGGHVNPVDLPDPVRNALRRELVEELNLPGVVRSGFAAIVNDDTTAVGSVHLGLVAVVEPAAGEVSVRERDTMSGSFASLAALAELHARERDGFESWSALLLDRIEEVLAWAPWPDSCSRIPSTTRTSTT